VQVRRFSRDLSSHAQLPLRKFRALTSKKLRTDSALVLSRLRRGAHREEDHELMPASVDPMGARRPRLPHPTRWARLLFLMLSLSLAVRMIVQAVPMVQDPAPLPLPYAYIPSPNCDDRPPGAEVTCIVLHATVEPTTEGTIGIFLNPAKRVSAHFVVGRDGRVVQMVPIEKRAWHAGVSVLESVRSVNDYSVGIEMVNLNDGKDPYTDAQMQAVAGILRFVRSHYTVPDARIVSHAQIALPAGRKSDPLNFDFDKIRALARIDAAHPAAMPPAIGDPGDTEGIVPAKTGDSLKR
jgi:N-acetylmuramoyl-L-alanine amidase